MKKVVIIFFILMLLLESCAMHKEFPFMCFKHECVVNQFKFTKVKASLKFSISKMNLKASMRKKKRYANKRKQDPIKVKTENSDEPVYSDCGIGEFELLKQDSILNKSISDTVTTFGFNVGIGNLDTVITLKYKVLIDSISWEDSLMLSNFFNNRKDEKMKEIMIQEYAEPNTKSKNSRRINNIMKYLNELHVPNFIITVNSQILLPEGRKDERVELRIF